MELIIDNPGEDIVIGESYVRLMRVSAMLHIPEIMIVVAYLNENGTLVRRDRIMETDKVVIDNMLASANSCEDLSDIIYTYLESKVDGIKVDNEIAPDPSA